MGNTLLSHVSTVHEVIQCYLKMDLNYFKIYIVNTTATINIFQLKYKLYAKRNEKGIIENAQLKPKKANKKERSKKQIQ